MDRSWLAHTDKLNHRLSVAEALIADAEGLNYESLGRLNQIEHKRRLSELYEAIGLARRHLGQLVRELALPSSGGAT